MLLRHSDSLSRRSGARYHRTSTAEGVASIALDWKLLLDGAGPGGDHPDACFRNRSAGGFCFTCGAQPRIIVLIAVRARLRLTIWGFR